MSTSATVLAVGRQGPAVRNDTDGGTAQPLKQRTSDQERTGAHISPRPARPPRPERPRPPVDRSPQSTEQRQRPERPPPPCLTNHSPRPADNSPRPVNHSPRPERPPRPNCPPRPDRPSSATERPQPSITEDPTCRPSERTQPSAIEHPQPRVPRRPHQNESASRQPRPYSQPQPLVDRPKSPATQPATRPATRPVTRPTTRPATRPADRPRTQHPQPPQKSLGERFKSFLGEHNIVIIDGKVWACRKCGAENQETVWQCRSCGQDRTTARGRSSTVGGHTTRERATDTSSLKNRDNATYTLRKGDTETLRKRGERDSMTFTLEEKDAEKLRKRGERDSMTFTLEGKDAEKLMKRGEKDSMTFTLEEKDAEKLRNRDTETSKLEESLAQMFARLQPHFSEDKDASTSPSSPRKGYWSCSNCTYENPLTSSQCAMCQASHTAQPGTDSDAGAATPIKRKRSISQNGLSEGEKHTLTMQQIRKLDEDEALAKWLTIVEECKSKKSCFKDPDFPPTAKSLYIDPTAPVRKWPVYGWHRCSQTLEISGSYSRHDQWTVYRNPCSSDIAQGMVGDCWFMSALAVVAEIPELLQQIVINKEYCPEGVYQIRLCKDGLWKVLIVDDWLPCHRNKQLLFSNARRRQLWVPLIEKGLAKLFGCYEAIEKHKISTGLSILTGYPSEQLTWKGTDPVDTEGALDPEVVWERMLSLKAYRYPMGAYCGRKFVNPEEYKKVGLQYQHGYSVLDIQQVGALRVIKLRNPWGRSSWTGWRWQKDHEAEVSGIFWMGAPDFFKYFSAVDYCKYHPMWHSARVKGTISPHSKQVVSFQVTTATEIEFTLYQPTYYGAEAAVHTPNCIAMMVLEVSQPDNSVVSLPKSLVVASDGTQDPFVSCSAVFTPGHYAVLPLVFGRETDGEFSYSLALFSAKAVVMNGLATPKPGFTAESFFHCARQSGRINKVTDTLVTYQFELVPSFYFLIAENRDSRTHYSITCKLTLDNLVSTRGSPATKDILPPKHRQVVYMLHQVYQEKSSYQIKWDLNSSHLGVQQNARHSPPISQSMADTHSPRFIK